MAEGTTGCCTFVSPPQAETAKAARHHPAVLFMVHMVCHIHRGRGVLCHTVPSHPVHCHAYAEPCTQRERPERSLSVKRFRIEEATTGAGHPAVGGFHEWKCGEAPPDRKLPSVPGGLNRPASSAQDGIFLNGPGRTKAAQPSLFLRPIGALNSIVKTIVTGTPCTFAQEAMVHEETVGLGGALPFHQSVHR